MLIKAMFEFQNLTIVFGQSNILPIHQTVKRN